MSVWSVEAVTEFIRLFREHSCLWKIRSRDYTNRNKRNEAYDELVEFCKSLGFASANREFVTKKIQNLRGAFRKELKKVLDSKSGSGSQDATYQPSLWYYDLLLFIKDQETPTPASDAGEDDYIECDPEVQESRTSSSRVLETPAQRTSVPSPPSSEHIIVEVPARGLKRKLRSNVIDSQFLLQKKLMNACTEALKNKKELSEYEALSITIAKKLEKMNYLQALHAETIIHSVLRRGLLNQLSETTDVCDRQCNRTIVLSASNRPSSSSSVHAEASYHNSSLLPKLETQDDPLM